MTTQPAMSLNDMFDALENETFSREDQYALIHDAAIECVKSAVDHNNYDTANRLVLLLQDKIHKPIFDQLIAWFTANGPFAWKETEDKNFHDNMKFRKARGRNPVVFDLQAAQKNPWYKPSEDGGMRFRKTRNEEAPPFDIQSIQINPRYPTGEE